jgi:hypothetical protein
LALLAGLTSFLYPSLEVVVGSIGPSPVSPFIEGSLSDPKFVAGFFITRATTDLSQERILPSFLRLDGFAWGDQHHKTKASG